MILVLTVGILAGQTRSVVSVSDLGKVGIRSIMENGMWRDLSGGSFSAFVVNFEYVRQGTEQKAPDIGQISVIIIQYWLPHFCNF